MPNNPPAGTPNAVEEARKRFVGWMEQFTVIPTMTYSQIDANLDALIAAVRAEERECLNGLLREERKLVRRATLAEVREKVIRCDEKEAGWTYLNARALLEALAALDALQEGKADG